MTYKNKKKVKHKSKKNKRKNYTNKLKNNLEKHKKYKRDKRYKQNKRNKRDKTHKKDKFFYLKGGEGKEGWTEGRAEGWTEGRAEGWTEGRAEGEGEGEEEDVDGEGDVDGEEEGEEGEGITQDNNWKSYVYPSCHNCEVVSVNKLDASRKQLFTNSNTSCIEYFLNSYNQCSIELDIFFINPYKYDKNENIELNHNICHTVFCKNTLKIDSYLELFINYLNDNISRQLILLFDFSQKKIMITSTLKKKFMQKSEQFIKYVKNKLMDKVINKNQILIRIPGQLRQLKNLNDDMIGKQVSYPNSGKYDFKNKFNDKYTFYRVYPSPPNKNFNPLDFYIKGVNFVALNIQIFDKYVLLMKAFFEKQNKILFTKDYMTLETVTIYIKNINNIINTKNHISNKIITNPIIEILSSSDIMYSCKINSDQKYTVTMPVIKHENDYIIYVMVKNKNEYHNKYHNAFRIKHSELDNELDNEYHLYKKHNNICNNTEDDTDKISVNITISHSNNQ